MKVKLNIKREEKPLSNINWKMTAVFGVVFLFSMYWIKGSYNNAYDSIEKIKKIEGQIKMFKENTLKTVALQKNSIDKQYIDSGALNSINEKIRLFEKLSSRKNKLYDFFNGLEASVTGEIFITKLIPSGDKNYSLEGSSNNADNITKFIDNLKKVNYFDKIELKQISGDNTGAQKNLKFKVAFSYECDSNIIVEDVPAPAENKK